MTSGQQGYDVSALPMTGGDTGALLAIGLIVLLIGATMYVTLYLNSR